MRLKVFLLFASSFLLFCLLLLPFPTHSQFFEENDNVNADSLYQVLSRLSGTEKIDTLNKIAFRVAKDYPDSCRKLANQTIKISDSLYYKKNLADGYQNLGSSNIVTNKGKPD